MEKLAVHGGSPVRGSLLPYGQQWIDEDDIQAVIQTLKSDFLTQGPAIAAFERNIADYAGARYAVAFANGTAALHGACFAAGIGKGDEVITTPITFAASSNCVLYQGGTPVFADIKLDTYNIDPVEIEKKINPRTKALIPVDFSGQPAEMDVIMEIAREHGLVVIEDAAHSLGASYHGRKVGTFADMTMFSFHPVKHITTGEGGVIVTDREDYYRGLLQFRSHGITRDPALLEQDAGPWYYEMQHLGYNYRITDLQAALGSSQLCKLGGFVERRREISKIYNKAFSTLEGIRIPYQHPKAESSWHLYVLHFDPMCFSGTRRDWYEAIRAENIGVNVHYIPVYWMPYYRDIGYSSFTCRHAEHYYAGALSIPLFPKMSNKDVEDVIHAVQKVHEYFVK